MVLRTCECCYYSTIYKNRFEEHIRSSRHLERQALLTEQNTGREYYRCTQCPKQFGSKSGLYRHIKTHRSSSVSEPITERVVDHINIQLQPIAMAAPTTPVTNHTTNTTHNTMNVVCVNNPMGDTGVPDEFNTPLEVSRHDFDILIHPHGLGN